MRYLLIGIKSVGTGVFLSAFIEELVVKGCLLSLLFRKGRESTIFMMYQIGRIENVRNDVKGVSHRW